MINLWQNKWLNFSLFNLALVALLGVLMRYKIGFEFPYFDQKNIQHAHSHFAFSGWITHTIFVLLTVFIQYYVSPATIQKYKLLITGNLICAYGMLLSFAVQGYGAVSIFFSSAAVLTGWLFSFYYLKDLKSVEKQHPSQRWFKAALLFNVISSLGTFALAYMMATKNIPQNAYLASVYFYLHFQYNGFFFFACMGLLYTQFYRYLPDSGASHRIFWLFALACVPAYFLSTLWAGPPVWLYTIIVLAAAAQLLAWIKFLLFVRQNISILKTRIPPVWQYLFLLIGIALSIKLVLQMGSTIPVISQLAFGFRPIVIAYLHLVLLAVISIYLLTYIFSFEAITKRKNSKTALWVFVFGVFLNEFILMIQGVFSFSYTLVPFVNEALFVAAIIMFGSISALFIIQAKNKALYD